MPYVTSIERLALRKGIREGIEALLQVRFGEEGLKLMPEINQIDEEVKLREILQALKAGDALDEVRRLWSPAA